MGVVVLAVLSLVQGQADADDGVDESTLVDALTIYDQGRWAISLFPWLGVSNLQSVVGAGAAAKLGIGADRGLAGEVSIIAAMGYAPSDWGIPDDSFNAQIEGRFTLGFGSTLHWANSPGFTPLRGHSLSYALHGFAATNGTTQLLGAVAYAWANERWLAELSFENDFLVFLGRDEFRTGALRLRVERRLGRWRVGAALRLLLWTGSTFGLPSLDRGEVYDLTGQLGADASHGILAVELSWELVRVSVGYDSDRLRRAVQDFLHDIIDDGRIPAVPRDERIYLSVSISPFASMY